MALPIPSDVLSLRWVFALLENNSQVEIAEVGLSGQRVHHVGNNVSWQSDLDAFAREMRDSWRGHVDPSLFSTCVALTRTEAYHLGTDGKTIDKGTAPTDATHGWRGNVGGCLPWEVALCVTEYGYDPTAFNANARSQRGRIYLPGIPTTAMASGTPKIASDKMDSYMTSFAAFFNDMQGKKIGEVVLTQDSVNLGILSRTKGTFTKLHTISMDNKPDSQRRRQNKLGGSKSFADIAGS